MHASHTVALGFLLARAACGDDGRDPPPDCSWHYEMEGDSQENAHFYAEDGREVARIAIDADERCTTATVELEHRDTAARLLEPKETCVRSSEGENTNLVSVVYTLDCDCHEPWEWIVTDKAPPVTAQLQIKTVPGCDGG